MKKLNLYKVSWRDKAIGDFLNKVKKYITTDDVNKIYEQYRTEHKLKVKFVRTIDILL